MPEFIVRLPRFAAIALLLTLALTADPNALRAQAEWRLARTMPTEAAMVLDEARGCIVLAGDAIPDEDELVTLEWDHADWRDCTNAGAPTALMTHRLVYDRSNARILRYAGQVAFGHRSETWEYRAGRWQQLTPPTQPSPRQFFAFGYDAARERAVLFGGWGPNFARLDDTWEFDGVTWTQRSPATVPPKRYYSAMAWDEVRQELVMFGGFGQTLGPLADTWLYDGNDWRNANPATIVPGRGEHTMAWDRASQRIVMFGGLAADTWEWNGSDWTNVVTPTAPPSRQRAAMATHRDGGVLLYGGTWQRSDLWRYFGGEWYAYHDHRMLREQSGQHALLYDDARDRVVWIGDDIDDDMATWEHDGRAWHDVTAGTRPARRRGFAAAFDAERGTAVLFGGVETGGITDATWLWNGTTWQQAAAAVRPPARQGHGMAFDPSTRRVVLFGGSTAAPTYSPFDDTWTFDGGQWQQVTGPGPGLRAYPSMATDSVRGRVVMFGGNAGTLASSSDETWAFRHGAWTRLQPTVRPPGRSGAAMAFDPHRDRIVLHGGDGASNYEDTWEFDGVTWSPLNVPDLDIRGEQMLYHRGIGAMWVKGFFTPFGNNDVWRLDVEPRAGSVSYGNACPAIGPPPTLTVSAEPYFGNHSFQVEIQGEPHAISLLVLGLMPANLPIQGCTLLVAPGFGLRATIANGFGFAALHQQVPLLPEFRGVHLYYQAGQFDPVAGTFEYSAGLDLTLGN